ncbi:MAG TPA: proline--tRNA ligase [Gemmatales bacterium]|nr:proline--tRNA ligase [Gemmatales bacterium]
MRVSHLFGETLREAPADVDVVSHQLLLRAGYVRQLAAGIFSYLPLAHRSMRKIEQVLREEMNAIGGQEMTMPVVHPAEPWQQTGRWQVIDESLARFKDRKDRDMVLAMTHEEVVGVLCSSEVKSWRQLPMLVYQIQTKFRDEARPRGGLIRVREFTMKDSYSLDKDEAGLKKQYAEHYHSYFRMYARCGLPVISVGSDTGMMGGKVAHEFMYVTPIGEDTLVIDEAGYAANQEVAQFVKTAHDGGAAQAMEKVHTPNCPTIDDLAKFLKVEAKQTMKMVFFMGTFQEDDRKVEKLVAAAVRGDMEVNQTQVTNKAKALATRPAHPEEIVAAGMVPGYASPIGIAKGKAVVVLDDLLEKSSNLVSGANEAGYHYKNVNVGRDFAHDVVGNIALAQDGYLSVDNNKPLKLVRGVEVGNIFQLGVRYSVPLNCNFADETGKLQPVVMGSYGIGVGRLLACVAEEHRDQFGLTLPISVAPFEVNLVMLSKKDETKQKAEQLYADLQKAGIEVLFDDRDAAAGVKFTDADLRGMPLRITISDKSLEKGGVELKHRKAGKDFTLVPLAEIIPTLKAEIAKLHGVLKASADQSPKWK